jgi:hypothetical protein
MQNITRMMARVHKVLALVIGAQLLIWIVSGLFFSLRPIEAVRGNHLRSASHEMFSAPPAPLVPVEQISAAVGEDLMSLTLRPYLGGLVWVADTHGGYVMFDAVTGEKRSPIPEAEARRVAEAGWAGDGKLAALAWVEKGPREAGRGEGEALWRAQFKGREPATVWIHSGTGEILSVRTDWWRTFDLLFGLHIMDWAGRETVSFWWLKLTAFGALVFALSGVGLVIDRMRKKTLFR